MRNQPKYNLFKNTSYALKGLKDLIQTETSFNVGSTVVFLSIFVFVTTWVAVLWEVL